MSRHPTLIVCSLLANIALGAVLYGLHRKTVPATEPPPVAINVPTAETVLENQVWTKINSGADDSSLVARLRELGFPDRVVRSIVSYRVRRKYADQIHLLMHREETPYWRRSSYAESLSPDALTKLQAINRDISKEVRQLLGTLADSHLPGDYGRSDSRKYGSLSSDKIFGIDATEQDYADLTTQVEGSSHGIHFPEDREKLAYLEKEKQADLARLLTPDELDQYERRNSPAAYVTRKALQYLDGATEDEFLSLYRLQHDFDQSYGRDYLSPAEQDRRQAAKSELNEQIKSALGAERYAEYQIVTDSNFESMRDFSLANGLTASTAKSLVALQRDFNKQAEAVQADKTLTEAQREEKFQAAEQEARKNLASYLGDEKYALYQKGGYGDWLTKLATAKKKNAR